MYTLAFDLDDTLYDRAQPLKKAFQGFIQDNRIDFWKFHEIFQINGEIAFVKEKNQIWTLEQSHIFRIKETLQQLGLEVNEEQAIVFQKTYEQYQQAIVVYPLITEILDFLIEKEVLSIIITNGPKFHQRNKIKNLGLETYFTPEKIFVSGEEGIAKPDKGIFQLAEERFQLDKATTWYIGDSYPNDIIGAREAGWNSIWFNPRNEKREDNIATSTVSSTPELFDLIKRMFE
ncbi:HAD family hydrolase [Oceanobacillus alkalisoli]|uniref:HAD family hydrolase n=1 Tax=Oceanobacillus alkalisoli TaxID=2925113 RepID=UPI001F11C849|nr:HAD family hydrolase [Oceanobacillus alkalisoli]MCF3943016.1 HAD family hydrolase [Oceanobacillus alkalisoli]